MASAAGEERVGESPVSTSEIDSIAMDERQRMLIKVIMITRHRIREYFGLEFGDRWGYFLDYHLSSKVHSFLDWPDYPEGNALLKGHIESVYSAVISTDGFYLYTGSKNGIIIRWDLMKQTEEFRWQSHIRAVFALCLHSSGLLASGTGEGSIKIWNVQKKCDEMLKELRGLRTLVNGLDFNSTATLIVAGSSDKSVRVWDVQTGDLLYSLRKHRDEVRSVLFIGKNIISGGWDNSVRIWDSSADASASQIRRVTDGISNFVSELRVSRDKSFVVCSMAVGFIVYRWPEMEVVNTVLSSSYFGDIHPINAHYFAAADTTDGKIKVWDWAKSEVVMSFVGHTMEVRCLRFTPDGARLITVATDGTVKIWDTSDLLE